MSVELIDRKYTTNRKHKENIMSMNTAKFYKCYSKNQRDWIEENGLLSLASGINEETKKRYWIFMRGRVLQMLLDEYKQGLNKK